MSVINRMLQDLDRRNAMGGPESEQAPQQVKPVSRARGGHEWFWRIVSVLLLAAVGWVVWIAYQIRPQPIATDLAFKAATRVREPIAARPAAPMAPPVAAPQAAPPPPAPALEQAPDSLKLARAIETPIGEPRGERTVPQRPVVKKEAPAAAPVVVPQASSKGTVDKRDLTRSSADVAESHFRRAAALLGQARAREAEEQLVAALQADSSHRSARQAFVALLLEHGRTEAAERMLREGLALDAGQPQFAVALARILLERREYGAALGVLEMPGAAGRSAEVLALRGIVLQRQGRHGDAAAAFQGAVDAGAQPGTTWVSYAISLEALGKRPEAVQAYRRALGTAPLAREVRDYAENRIRSLE
jgi:MSHA biogenesis protein MshN